jgi:hypothetical protein
MTRLKRLKSLSTLIACLLVGSACAWLFNRPPLGVITISAQTLPITKTVAWDPSPDPCGASAPCPVINYTVTLDTAVVGSPTTTTQVVNFTTVGLHTIRVTATNLWGTSSPATLTVNVIVPNAPANTRIQ